MTVGRSMYLLLALLPPMAFTMKTRGASNGTGASNSSSDRPRLTLSSTGVNITTVETLETIFARSEEEHRASMEQISRNLNLEGAIEVLHKRTIANLSDTQTIARSSSLQHIENALLGRVRLRAGGFGGLDGARKLLNGMIHESALKYDTEIARCTDYYSKQCALMQVARGEIAASNGMGANARALILDAANKISRCDKSIPKNKIALKNNNAKCKADLHGLEQHLQMIEDDIGVMSFILELTDCDAKLIQMDKLMLLRCRDRCANKPSISFNHDGLEKSMEKLKSKAARDMIADIFADIFSEGAESDDSLEFVQVPGSEYQRLVSRTQLSQLGQESLFANASNVTKTKFNNPPAPKTEVPMNPCHSPPVPSATNKRAAKCTLGKGSCYKLQARFMQLMAGITDERDQTKEDIEQLEESCKEMADILATEISHDESLMSSSQTKLAEATEKEATASEKGRKVAASNAQYDADLKKQMKTCTGHYVDFETEMCALKKIRGELYKKFAKKPVTFQDCETSKWTPGECSASCEGGVQTLKRDVVAMPVNGAECLPLSATKSCNRGPCPVDCVVGAWSGWQKCSSKCDGGLQSRVREVKVQSKYKGTPCGATSQSQQCNGDPCEKKCVLSEWTEWTSCSKDCDGGTMKRSKWIKEKAHGTGTCADKWSVERLTYKQCNMQSCVVAHENATLKCSQKLDVVLLLDGTPKSGKDGWANEVKAAQMFVDAFGSEAGTNASFSVVYYSGPRTWSGVSKCTGQNNQEVNVEQDCHVKIAQDFTDNLADVKTAIDGLQYQPGTKLLSLALTSAQSEFALGRGNVRTVVVAFIDGEPLSYRNTRTATRHIRKKARLLWVPVVKFSPLANFKKWATRRWQENLVSVPTASEWGKPVTVTHLIANICPSRFQEVRAVSPAQSR